MKNYITGIIQSGTAESITFATPTSFLLKKLEQQDRPAGRRVIAKAKALFLEMMRSHRQQMRAAEVPS